MVSKQAGVPFREHMLVVERPFVGLAPHEAAVPDADVVDETSGAEKDDFAVLIDDRTVTDLSPHRSSFQSGANNAASVRPYIVILHVHSTHSL
jgi:hypothetical protein